jgi:hypothetical protein
VIKLKKCFHFVKNNTAILFTLIASTLFISCHSFKEENDLDRENRLANQMDSLIISSISTGNFKDYNVSSNYYLLKERYDKLYYFAFIMSNKHNCPEAFFHMFIVLDEPFSRSDILIDNKTKYTEYLSYYYLLKSYELGFETAKYSIEEKFKDVRPNNSSYYLKKATAVVCSIV